MKFLDDFRNEVEKGEIHIGDEKVSIPKKDMEVEYGFKIEDGQSEIELEIKWR